MVTTHRSIYFSMVGGQAPLPLNNNLPRPPHVMQRFFRVSSLWERSLLYHEPTLSCYHATYVRFSSLPWNTGNLSNAKPYTLLIVLFGILWWNAWLMLLIGQSNTTLLSWNKISSVKTDSNARCNKFQNDLLQQSDVRQAPSCWWLRAC